MVERYVNTSVRGVNSIAYRYVESQISQRRFETLAKLQMYDEGMLESNFVTAEGMQGDWIGTRAVRGRPLSVLECLPRSADTRGGATRGERLS